MENTSITGPESGEKIAADPPLLASDYPHETGEELAEETADKVHAHVQHPDHTPGEHPDMPFQVASDYPAETGEELQKHSRHS